jgi:peptidoglycan/xylan/chitin deacetylase (PgdA/CDA1 family)
LLAKHYIAVVMQKRLADIYSGVSSLFSEDQREVLNMHAVHHSAARTLWHFPGRFGIARTLGPSYELRCVVFHDVSVSESSFTKGMRVSMTPANFEAALGFITRHYSPVSLQDVLDAFNGRRLPPRAILVTCDDGYASVADIVAPLCVRFNVPAVFFLNAAFLDNRRLAPDNLVCFIANECGMGAINQAVQVIKGKNSNKLQSLVDVFSCFFPAISLSEREIFLEALMHVAGINEQQLAAEARLYLSRNQVRQLASSQFEIGDHTYSHVRCRHLSAEGSTQEIDRNKAELEDITGRKVRSFSVPYGSSADLTDELLAHLDLLGHEAVFLSESVANPRSADRVCFDRVSVQGETDAAYFCELEVLPRLRALRNHLRLSPNRS